MTFERATLAEYVEVRDRWLTAAHLGSLRSAEELARMALEGAPRAGALRLYLGRDVEGHGERVATGYALRSTGSGGWELVEVFTSEHPEHPDAEVVEGQVEEARADARRRCALRVVGRGDQGHQDAAEVTRASAE